MNKPLASGKGHTSRVRGYARDRYVRPAKQAGQRRFRIVVGEVHKALGLRNRVPLVCNALSSRKFLKENSLRLVDRSGPPSGQSTTVTLTYEIVGGPDPDVMGPLRALRGAGAAVFAELGGGENFLRKERREFSLVLPAEPKR